MEYTTIGQESQNPFPLRLPRVIPAYASEPNSKVEGLSGIQVDVEGERMRSSSVRPGACH